MDPKQATPKPSGWDEFLLFLKKLPRLWSLARQFIAVWQGTEAELDLFLDDLRKACDGFKNAKTLEEKRAAALGLSDSISRL